MAGRKPKPTAVKKLESSPGKRKLKTKEPMPGNRVNTGVSDNGLNFGSETVLDHFKTYLGKRELKI